MKAKEELKERHLRAVERLNKAAQPKTNEYGLVSASTEVAKLLGISPNTVINYIMGKTKDGYLTEAITKEFKDLIIKTD